MRLTAAVKQARTLVPMTAQNHPICVPRSFALTRNEKTIFDIFINTAAGTPVVCRVAGGWVRDKLVSGNSGHDMDIVLDTMMGYTFAKRVMDHVRANPYPGAKLTKVSKIAANPDKSKHLETATCRLLGLDLDFVNLRSETYMANSRIPDSVSFGTPEQDSVRRDCTINSLFYNIHTDQVEDHCRSGLSDIKNKLIRTPQPPLVTFLDDPLRMLRLVRFAARFKFCLDPLIYSTVAENLSELKHHLTEKVSKERVGVEMTKIMQKPNPSVGVAVLLKLDLYTTISFPPLNDRMYDPQLPTSDVTHVGPTLVKFPPAHASYLTAKATWSNEHKMTSADVMRIVCDQAPFVPRLMAILEWMGILPNTVNHAMALPNSMPVWTKYFLQDDSYVVPASFSVLLQPFMNLWQHTARPGTVVPLVASIVQTNYKLSNRDAEWVAHAHHVLPAISNMVHVMAVDGNFNFANHPFRFQWSHDEAVRVVLGMFVQLVASKHVHQLWPVLFGLSMANHLCLLVDVDSDPASLVLSVKTPKFTHSNAEIDAVAFKYRALLDRIFDLDLDTAWESKPILDGNEVASVLSIPKGPEIKDALGWVMEYQLARPDSTITECKQWLVDNYYRGFPNPPKKKIY